MSFDVDSPGIGTDKENVGVSSTEKFDRIDMLSHLFPTVGSSVSRSESGSEESGAESYIPPQRSGVGVKCSESSRQFSSDVLGRLSRLEAAMAELLRDQKRKRRGRRDQWKDEVEFDKEDESRDRRSGRRFRESNVRDKHVRFSSRGNGSRRVVCGRGQSRVSLLDLWFGSNTVRGRKGV